MAHWGLPSVFNLKVKMRFDLCITEAESGNRELYLVCAVSGYRLCLLYLSILIHVFFLLKPGFELVVLLHTWEIGSGLRASCTQTPWLAARHRCRRHRIERCAGVGAPSGARPPSGSPVESTHWRPSESGSTHHNGVTTLKISSEWCTAERFMCMNEVRILSVLTVWVMQR